MISSFGILLVIIMIIFASYCSGGKKDVSDISGKNKNSETSGQTPSGNEQILLTANDFVMPAAKSFDLSSDYIDFLPNKQLMLPDKKILDKTAEKLINDQVDDSLKFNFEKKEAGGVK